MIIFHHHKCWFVSTQQNANIAKLAQHKYNCAAIPLELFVTGLQGCLMQWQLMKCFSLSMLGHCQSSSKNKCLVSYICKWVMASGLFTDWKHIANIILKARLIAWLSLSLCTVFWEVWLCFVLNFFSLMRAKSLVILQKLQAACLAGHSFRCR